MINTNGRVGCKISTAGLVLAYVWVVFSKSLPLALLVKACVGKHTRVKTVCVRVSHVSPCWKRNWGPVVPTGIHHRVLGKCRVSAGACLGTRG